MTKQSLVFILLCFSGALQAEKVSSMWDKTYSKKELTTPSNSELKIFEAAISAELKGEESAAWDALNMQRIVNSDGLVIKENDTAQQGRGVFMLNTGIVPCHALLQTPHAKADLYTGRIAALLFSQGVFCAAQWNTVPRYARIIGAVGKADMAHLNHTYWQAFTRVFARQFPQARIIQLHGYDRSKRKSKQGKDSDMIISAGHYYPPSWVQQVAACLKQNMPMEVSLFPYDVKELGATTNTQGRLLQVLGHEGFLHIEMSLKLRKALLKQRELRQLLLNCIQE